jgi:HEPN domain-containing protein
MADHRDLARELLVRARDDELAAQALLRVGEVSDVIVAFHAQQAVEKALKAALASIGAEFPFTHDLGLLMQLCEDADLDLPNSLAEADLLTPYAAQLRYGSPQSATVSRVQALEFATEARSWAASLV